MVTDRVAGPTRYSTAGAIAGQADFDGATTAILATGENFPDALAASGLAGANAPAPIILTETEQLTDAASIAMTQIETLDDVLVVGGTAAIQDDVVTEVEDAGYSVTRIAGTDRYETAAAIANEVTAGEIDGLTTALIASGEVFADAVAGGPIAYAGQLPILLVNTEGVPAATEAALDEAGIEQVILLGGTARITDETETELEGMTGNAAVRVAGVDRFATAADIGRFAEAEYGWAPNELLLANGLNFPDALACGPLGGERSAPIVLTASIPEPTATYIDEVSDTLEKITACGGTAAVSNEDLTAAETLGETTENDEDAAGTSRTSALEGPELQDCTVAGLDINDLEIVYAYTFDEEVDEDSVNEAAFKLYDADTRNPAFGDTLGEDADIDGDTVNITYSLIDGAVLTAALCAVEEGAIEDEDGDVNPPQSLRVGSDRSGTGSTVGPDLVGAEVTEDDNDPDEIDDEFVVEYIFDVATGADLSELGLNVDTLDETDFIVVLRDGSVVEADSCETSPEDDEASTTIECTFLEGAFPDPGEDDDGFANEDIDDAVRAVVRPGAIDLFGGFVNGNVLQAAELSRSGNSDAPDLVGVELDDDDDTATFTFDENIDTADGTLFGLYFADCDDASPLGAECSIFGLGVNDIDGREVEVQFNEDVVNQFTAGGFVEDGAVTADDNGQLNAEDEVGLTTSFEAGQVAGPQLDGVEITVDTNASGFFDEFQVEFTFTKDVEDSGVLDPNGFAIWFDNEDDNAERLDLDNCEADDNVVTCTSDDEESDIANATVASVDYGTVESDELYTLDDDEISEAMPNPEGSFEVEVPDFDVDEDA